MSTWLAPAAAASVMETGVAPCVRAITILGDARCTWARRRSPVAVISSGPTRMASGASSSTCSSMRVGRDRTPTFGTTSSVWAARSTSKAKLPLRSTTSSFSGAPLSKSSSPSVSAYPGWCTGALSLFR